MQGRADDRRPALDLGRRGPDRHREYSGEPGIGRVAADRLARPRESLEAFSRFAAERGVELGGEPGGDGRRAPGPAAAHDDRRMRALGDLRRGAVVVRPVMPAVEREALPVTRPGVPEPGDDRQLLFQPVEPLLDRRERQAERRMLACVPRGADTELDPAAAHVVDRRDDGREQPGRPEGRGRHQRAEPDPAGVARQAGQRRPAVGRPVVGIVRIAAEQVVGAEEGIEARALGGQRQGQDVVVASAVPGLHQDPQPDPAAVRLGHGVGRLGRSDSHVHLLGARWR